MANIKNMEIIQLNTVDGKLQAIVSYQDTTKKDDLNNGYNIMTVPVNIRELQLSIRGNLLVNQSVKSDFAVDNLHSKTSG